MYNSSTVDGVIAIQDIVATRNDRVQSIYIFLGKAIRHIERGGVGDKEKAISWLGEISSELPYLTEEGFNDE